MVSSTVSIIRVSTGQEKLRRKFLKVMEKNEIEKN